MAKIIYYSSPISNTEVTEYNTKYNTVIDVLKELGIHTKPSLAVRINGKSEKVLDLSTHLSENDIVEIKQMVFGSGSEGSKNTIATIVQIVALIASVVIPGGQAIYAVAKAAILVAGAVISGAIRRAGLKNSVPDRNSSTETEADAFSLSAAQNEARPLEPMSIIMGSHRIAPDFASRPYSFYSGGGNITNVTKFVNSFINIDEFTGTIPAGWLSANVFNQHTYVGLPGASVPSSKNFWNWPLRVQDGFSAANFIADAIIDNTQIFPPNNLSRDYTSFSSFSQHNYKTNGIFAAGRGPVVIEHYHPTDPLVISNGGLPFKSTLQLLCWSYYSQFHYKQASTLTGGYFTEPSQGNNAWENNYITIYRYLMGFSTYSTNPTTADAQFAAALGGATGVFAFRNLYEKKDYDNPDRDFFVQFNGDITIDYPYYSQPPEVIFSTNLNTRAAQVRTFITNLNDTNTIQGNFARTYGIPEVPRSQEVRHLLHYGIGDLEVSDRRIANTPLEKITGQQTLLSTKNTTAWPLDQAQYHSNVKIIDGADLVNNSEFGGPIVLENLLPSTVSNWITRETPDNCEKIQINIEGNSFESKDDGSYDVFGSDFEIQYREVSNSIFTLFDGSYFISSNRPEVIRETIDIPVSSGRYQIRIRKRTADPTDNKFIQKFAVTGFNFYIKDQNSYVAENREGLRLVATGSFNGTTQNYSALVEGKCWVFDGSTWNWEKTRNPAWWFLFYARGGFINQTANGTLTYPFSPTVGWINNADHVDNLERMFGAGLPDEQIDIERIKYWAVFCDAKSLNLDLVIREDNHVQEFLERIADLGRASSSFYRGKLSVVIEDPEQPVVAMYGMGNILKDSFSVTYVTEDLPDKIIGNYTDRDEKWSTKQVDSPVPNSTDTVRVVQVSLPGVTEKQQAQREVNLLAARQLYQRRQYSWKTDMEGLIVRRGDLVYLSHDITQYDQSGRVCNFKIENGFVTEIETEIILEETTHLMMRMPNGEIVSYEAEAVGKTLILKEEYPLSKAPYYPEGSNNENQQSSWLNSMPEDFMFFAGPKQTPGKIVRISEIHSDQDFYFSIEAVEEEPAMYSYEFDQVFIPGSDDSMIVSKVFNSDYKNLGNGKIELFWSLDGAIAVQIFNKSNPSIPLQVSGGSTVFGEKAILELAPDSVYNLVIEPVVIGVPYKKVSETIIVRT